MRVLVTGGAGFIGGHLVDAFISRGCRVVVLDDLSTGSRDNLHRDAVFVHGDIRDRATVEATFERESPEVVVHLAAQADVRRSMSDPVHDASVNVVGTLHLLDAARRRGTRQFVFSSTGGAVYGEPDELPVAETDPVAPLSCYGAAKRAAELYIGVHAQVYGLKATILRYANVYGPRQNPKGEAGVVAIFSLQLLEGKRPTIFGDGSKTRDYVYVGDVVQANLAAVDGAVTGIFNIGTGRRVTDREVFDAVRDAVGTDVEPDYAAKRPGEVDHIALDAGRAAEHLGWRPTVDFASGVELAVEHYRQRYTAG